MTEEGRVRMIKAEKVSYWKQFEHGMLSRDAVQTLMTTADTTIDTKDRYIHHMPSLKFNFHFSFILVSCGSHRKQFSCMGSRQIIMFFLSFVIRCTSLSDLKQHWEVPPSLQKLVKCLRSTIELLKYL